MLYLQLRIILLYIAVNSMKADILIPKSIQENRQYLPPFKDEYAKKPVLSEHPIVPKKPEQFDGTEPIQILGAPPVIDHILTPLGSERYLYTSAPYSVFHTQINVQSQDNEYTAESSKPHGNINLSFDKDTTKKFVHLPSRITKHAKEDINDAATHPFKFFYRPTEHWNYHPATSNIDENALKFVMIMPPTELQDPIISNKLIHKSKKIKSQHLKLNDSNLQGINIISSSVRGVILPDFNNLPNSDDTNIQVANILQNNLLESSSNIQEKLIKDLSTTITSSNTTNEVKEDIPTFDIIYNTNLKETSTSQPITHDTDLQEDGYHYKKPSIAFYY